MTDLQTLFATDPLKLGEKDLDELIADLRGRRAQFALENNKKAGTVKSKPTKPSVLLSAGLNLDLSILDGKK